MPDTYNFQIKYIKTSGFIISLLLATSLLITSAHAHAYNIIRSGSWTIQVDTLVGQIPMNIQPKLYSQCLGQNAPIPNIPDAGKSCSIIRHDINAGEIRWELQCQVNSGSRTGKGYVKYDGNFLRGQLDMKINHPNYKKAYHLQYKLKGRRTGPCQHP